MTIRSFLALLLLAATAVPAAAQFREVQPPPNRWASVWLGGYIDPGRVVDESGTWTFGSGFAAGLAAHHRVGQGLMLGVDLSLAQVPYERLGPANLVVGSGDARFATALASGRLRYGGGGDLGVYLTGAGGAFIYHIPDLDRWDPDLALLTGAGLEYAVSRTGSIFLEWGRFFVFHQRQGGVAGNTARHSHLKVGGRVGW
jgi:hypothetical protein